MFGVAFFNAVNFLLLFYAPLNFKEILFNLIVGCYLSGLVYEIIERQDLFKWEIPYFENSKFLMYKWAYIPIIIFYLTVEISKDIDSLVPFVSFATLLIVFLVHQYFYRKIKVKIENREMK